MRKRIFALLFVSVLVASLAGSALARGNSKHDSVPAAPPPPPKTAIHEVKEDMHGVEIVDPYRWLEDQNSPETRAWINTENAYTDSLISKLPGREELKERIARLVKIDTMGVPFVRGNRYFFQKRRADEDQSKLYMRKGIQGTDELLIDPLSMSPTHNITVVLNSVSHDGKLLVYGLRKGGADEIVPHLLDVDTHKELPDAFPSARYSTLSILPDKTGLYYGKVTREGPRFFFHKIGSNASSDTEIFGKGYGPETIIGGRVSEDGHYLVLSVSHGSASGHTELFYQDLKKKNPITPLVTDVQADFNAVVVGEKVFLRTDWNAPRGRVLEVNLNDPARDNWKEIIPQSESVIEGMTVVGGKLALRLTHNVISTVKIYDLDGKPLREIEPPTIGSVSGLTGQQNDNQGFYSFTSFHIPTTIYRYDVATGKQAIWFQQKVPIDSSKYEVQQVWYTSRDGTKVPMFLAHAKDLKLDGNNPVLLTGYGGFNLVQQPGFNATAAAWMMGGGVYAVANLRGGGEFGEAWHHAGMLEKKQNVFDDFIAAAEWLIKNNYTKPARLAISGGSNGGLLVGAALTQRPDLYGAVVCRYPLLDMLRYEKFLVARYWVPEYGSAENADQFKFIYAYSPYQHVVPGTKYPGVLLISGDSDTRVAPLHARKMTARLQAANASDKPILLHYDTDAGHSGGTPAGKLVDNIADELSFLEWQLGMLGGTGSGSATAQGK